MVHLLLGRACVHANWEHICAIIMDRSLIVVEAGLFELCTRLKVILLDGAKCALYFFLLESSVVIGKKLLH